MSKVRNIAAQYTSKTRTLIIETQSDTDQENLEEIVHDSEGDVWRDELIVDQAITLGCLSSLHLPSIDDADGITRRLRVVRCALTQLKESDNWHRFIIFQTLTK